ncbi:hypothetical protein FACS1894167_00870 [Synergistales bacterium]|nr:hypothetical protein FACS1894167_00870 [Synergistales bacterium]GHV52342.1 hypothetical protein FACS1894216_08310 [Synergistales bacterium]
MPNPEMANQWRSCAKTDYDVAVHDTTFCPIPIEIICYHSQQAAEKALKSVLVYHDEEVPRIHDLYRILELCLKHEPDLRKLSTQAKRLTKYAVLTRYPNEIDIEETDMRLALEDAEIIVNTISSLWQNQ